MTDKKRGLGIEGISPAAMTRIPSGGTPLQKGIPSAGMTKIVPPATSNGGGTPAPVPPSPSTQNSGK